VSAYGEFETILCHERFLVEGLTEMGYEVEVHADGACLRGYHGEERPERAHVIIRRAQLDGASNDIGFARGTDGRFRAIVGEYDRSIGYNRHWLDKVRERYQERQTLAAVKSKPDSFRGKEVIQMKEDFVVFVVCIVASAGLAAGVLYFDPFHVFQSSNAMVTRQVEEPKPADPPRKPKRMAKAAQRRVSKEAAVTEPASARAAVPTATPPVEAPAPPVPSANEITLGTQEETKTETYGNLALSAMTSKGGHVLQTFVYARDRGKVTTMIRLEDGKVSSKSIRPRRRSEVNATIQEKRNHVEQTPESVRRRAGEWTARTFGSRGPGLYSAASQRRRNHYRRIDQRQRAHGEPRGTSIEW